MGPTRRRVLAGGAALALSGPAGAVGPEVLGGRWRAAPDYGRLDPRGALAVGVRPARGGGVRLDVERLGSTWLVHDYGHGGAGFTLAWGSALRVAEGIARSTGDAPASIGVIGAGVVGLTAAVVLRRRWPRVPLTVYAAEVDPVRTTSWVAAGLVDPAPIAAAYGDRGAPELEGLLTASVRGLHGLPARFGVLRRDRFVAGPGGGRLPFPGPAVTGSLGEVLIADPTRLLPALRAELADAGVPFLVRRFADRRDLASCAEAVLVNATGLGARDLVGDPAVTPVRGHVVRLARTNAGQDWVLSAASEGLAPTWIACRHDDIVLGGTWTPGDDRTSVEPDDERVAEGLVARAERLLAAG